MSNSTRGVRSLILTSASALALVGVSETQAATRNAQLSVTVSVVAKCTVSSAALLSDEEAGVICTSGAHAAVSRETNGARPAPAPRRARGGVTSSGAAPTSQHDSTESRTQAQVVTILF